MKKNMKLKLANGGWDWNAIGAGGLGMAGTGAGIGSMIGGPPGAIVGAIGGLAIGGLMGGLGASQEDKMREEYEREANELQRKQRFRNDNMQLANFANAGKGFTGQMKKGGLVKVASNMAIAKGKTHEQGGIALNSNIEVENNETVVQNKEGTKVFSDNLGISPMANMLAKAKGELEQKYTGVVSELQEHVGKLSKAKNKYQEAGRQRKVDVKQGMLSKIEEGMQFIDNQLDQLFQSQQEINGGVGEEQPNQSKMTVGDGVAMKQGGLVKAKNGLFTEDPWYKQIDGELSDEFEWDKSQRPFALNSKDAIGQAGEAGVANVPKGVGKGSEFFNENVGVIVDSFTTLANLGSNLFARNRLKSLKVPEPMYDKAYTQDTHIPTSASLAAVDKEVNRMSKFIDSNVSNSIVARNAMGDIRDRAGTTKAGVLQNAELASKQIQGQNLANIQNVDSRNTSKTEEYLGNKFNQQAAIVQHDTNTAKAFVDDVKGVVQNKRLKDYQDLQLDSIRLSGADSEIYDLYMKPMIKGLKGDALEQYIKKNKLNWLGADGNFTEAGQQAFEKLKQKLNQ